VTFKKVRLIISPVSRPAWVKRYLPGVKRILREGGAEVEDCITQGPGDPARLAKGARGRFDAVVVAGGDGSINEALNALAGSETPLGIIPLGTVNVFAREMDIPLHPVKAAEVFLKSEAKAFDLGRMGERRFLLMASYGFDVWTLKCNTNLLKRLFGRYSYVITSLFLVPFYRDKPIQVYLDDESKPRRATFAVFSNARKYAGNHVLVPDADMHDGKLDVVLIDCPGRLGLFKIFLAVLRGAHLEKPWSYMAQARRVRFETSSMDLFQIDGDAITPSTTEIAVEPAAVRVAVPSAAL
jgi:YegS/Rv2252/BmrU family lipid kinase